MMLYRCFYGSLLALVAASVFADGHRCGSGCHGEMDRGYPSEQFAPDNYQPDGYAPETGARDFDARSYDPRLNPPQSFGDTTLAFRRDRYTDTIPGRYANQYADQYQQHSPAETYGDPNYQGDRRRYEGRRSRGHYHGHSHRNYASNERDQRGGNFDRRSPSGQPNWGDEPRYQQTPRPLQPMMPNQPFGNEDYEPIAPPSLPPMAIQPQHSERPPMTYISTPRRWEQF